VRDGDVSRQRLAPEDAINSKRAVFAEFGLNVDDYHRHLGGMVDYDAVPDKERYHKAVAYMLDFVDYCNDYQNHGTSVDIKEIWESYTQDETVVRLTNLDCACRRPAVAEGVYQAVDRGVEGCPHSRV
jgi:hypothetical protein